MSGLDRFIDYSKPDFIGRTAALEDRKRAPERILVTLAIDADAPMQRAMSPSSMAATTSATRRPAATTLRRHEPGDGLCVRRRSSSSRNRRCPAGGTSPSLCLASPAPPPVVAGIHRSGRREDAWLRPYRTTRGRPPEWCPAPVVISARGWYALGILALVYAVNIADRFVVSALIEPIKLELHLSDTAIGFLTGTALAIFYTGMGIPWDSSRIVWTAESSSRCR